jgi:hypothetical protein
VKKLKKSEKLGVREEWRPDEARRGEKTAVHLGIFAEWFEWFGLKGFVTHLVEDVVVALSE